MALRTTLLAAFALAAAGCFGPTAPELPVRIDALRAPASYDYADVRLLEAFSAASEDAYVLGSGDVLHVAVWGHADLSGEQVVGPDGRITLPVVGSFEVARLTRDEAAARIGEQLAPYYKGAAVTVRVDDYRSNRVSVLGGVLNPGTYAFEGRPTLLDALSQAGGVRQILNNNAPLRCSIQRGTSQLVWIDLRELLWHGRTELNVTLRAEDVVYVPDMEDNLVYILGEVESPGAFRLENDMTLVHALSRAGGPTVDADLDDTRLHRLVDGRRDIIDYTEVEADSRGVDVALQAFDIVYVPRRGLAKWRYFWQSVNPFAGLFGGG